MVDLTRLEAVNAKLLVQRNNTLAAKQQAENTLEQCDFEVEAAARLLIKKFGNPQGTVQIIQAVYQADTLNEIVEELDAMLGAISDKLPNPVASVHESAATQQEEQGVSAP